MGLHLHPIPDHTWLTLKWPLDTHAVDMSLAHRYLSLINICVFCDLQNVKDKSKPVVPSKDSKELDKLCKRFLIPTKNIQYYLLMCSSRKIPYSPHRRDWNFLGGGGFCKAKKFKEMYEA